MILLGAERYITQNYQQHKTAEDYSGAHLSPIKITGTAKVTKVVNHYQVHEDSINYDDFIRNQASWRDGDYYNCTSITGKKVRFHKNELGGNCVEVQGYVGDESIQYTMFHMASTNVQVGDIVDSNTILGYQGNTGLVNSSKSRSDVTYGTHVHMEVKNASGAFVNPRNYALGNIVIAYVSQSNQVDTTKDQILITADKINIRQNPTTDSLDIGDVYKGEIYTILDSKDDVLYTWYQIKTNRDLLGWVASSKQEIWIEVKKAVVEGEMPITPIDPPLVTPSDKEEGQDENKYELLFTCPKTDTYYLKLNEGEQLYLLKKEDH